MIKSVAILGTGGWGSSLAILWAHSSYDIVLWGHSAERVELMAHSRRNDDYLPAVQFPKTVRVTNDLAECAAAGVIVVVTPSVVFRSIAEMLARQRVPTTTPLLSCTKGIEHHTGARMSELAQEFFPDNPIAVLSGPNLADEVARRLPTATVLGCRDEALGAELQLALGQPHFRIYTSADVVGIELGGALKNVFAVAAGISDGFGFGDNSKAALVTRAFAELLRLGTAMGGEAQTFHGLSGAGDLIATCFSRLSRNRRVGEEIGRGRSIAEITAGMKTVAEGIPTARSAFECARRLRIDTPIIDQVYAVLHEGKPAQKAMQELLGRDQRSEYD